MKLMHGPRGVSLLALLVAACSSNAGGDGTGAGGSAGAAGVGGRGGSGGTSGAASAAGGTGGTAGAAGGSGGSAGSAGGTAGVDAGAGPQDTSGTADAGATDRADAAAAEAPGGGPAGGTILFVVGTSNGTTAPGAHVGDRLLRQRLEMQLGYTVKLAVDTDAAGALETAAAAADMLLVSESVSSANLRGKLRPVARPILNYEAFIQDEMGLTPPGPPGDPGEPAQFALGVKANETRIDIIDASHPLAAGLRGTVAVYKAPRSVTWGKVAASAKVVATLPGNRTGVAIYVYPRGAMLFDAPPAAGARIGFFLEDDDTVGSANVMTDDGLKLFDAAVKFTLEQQ